MELGISKSYPWVYGRRTVPDFQGRDGDNDEKGTTGIPTTSNSNAAHLGLTIPTPDASGRVSPDPTLSSSVPTSTPTRHTPPSQPRQYVVHNVSASRRTSTGRSRSRSKTRSASIQTHSHTSPMSGTQSVDPPQRQHNEVRHDTMQTVSPLPTLETEKPKESLPLSYSQSRHRGRKGRRSPLSSVFKSRLRGPSKPSSSPPNKFFPFTHFAPSMVLENSGSVARDHLASERTFLAYVRTSLALASTGVALVQLFTIADLTSRGTGVPLSSASRRMQKFARPLGVTMVALGLVVLGIAVYRYFLVQNALPEKNFPVARFSIAFISFMLGASVVVIFGALLGGRISG